MKKALKGILVAIGLAILTWGTEKILDNLFEIKLLIFLSECLSSIGHFFIKSINVPVWGIILIFFSPIIAVLTVGYLISQFRKSIDPVLQYKSDQFEGKLFEWQWGLNKHTNEYEIIKLNALCPKDKYSLDNDNGSMSCPICNSRFSHYDSVKISKLIIQKIRTNTYNQSPN